MIIRKYVNFNKTINRINNSNFIVKDLNNKIV
jgi:hypothetical protein